MLPVRLEAIVDGMEMQSDTMTSYLHRPSGRVLTVTEEALAAAEEDDEEWVDDEELAAAREILAGAAMNTSHSRIALRLMSIT